MTSNTIYCAEGKGFKIVSESNVAKYSGDHAKSASIDAAIEKNWNRKIKKTFIRGGAGVNRTYADNYACTIDRLKAKLEARKQKN